MTSSRRRLLAALFAAGLALLWEGGARILETIVIPPLTAVAVATWDLLLSERLYEELWASLLTYAVGLAISLVLGILVGTLMGLFRPVRWALSHFVTAGLAAPVIAFVPVFMMLFGMGATTRVLTVVIFSLWIVIVNTMTGMREVDPSLIEMGRSYGARGLKLFVHVRLPGAFPYILAGVRMGVARGMKGLINAEVLVAIVGLGGLVSRYGSVFSMDRLYAMIVIITAIALLSVRVVDLVAKTTVGVRE